MNSRILERGASVGRRVSAPEVSTSVGAADVTGAATVIEDSRPSLGTTGNRLHSSVVTATGAGKP